MDKSMQYLWRDRKRILGMPISFTKYALAQDRLFMEKGLLNLSLEEVILYRVRDIGVTCSLWQRIFRVGTVTVHSSDKTQPHLELCNIREPMRIKELIHQQVEEMKIARRLKVGELLDNDAGSCEDDPLE